MIVFLEDVRIEIDKNLSERSIKPFVIGRKNFLFSNTPKGAKSSAIIYSSVETAKENKLIPFEYLKYLFEQLPNIDTTNKDAVDQRLPWRSAEHTSELQSRFDLVCRLLLEKKNCHISSLPSIKVQSNA